MSVPFKSNRIASSPLRSEFLLTEAVIPGDDYQPQEGYALTTNSEKTKTVIDVAVSAPRITPLLKSLVNLLGDTLDVSVMIASDFSNGKGNDLFEREDIDGSIALSLIETFQDIIKSDGKFKLGFCNEDLETEVTLTQHKTIKIECYNFQMYWEMLEMLKQHNISRNDDMRFIHETHEPCTLLSLKPLEGLFVRFVNALAATRDVDDDDDQRDLHERNDPYGFRGDKWKNGNNDDQSPEP